MDGPTLVAAEADSGVTLIYNDKVTVQTEAAQYDKQEEAVIAPGNVHISGDMMDVTGQELHIDVRQQELHIEKNVHSIIKPRTENKKP
jgi:lipopolysaccharide assembly outer membrane protein LptD (OstA)